MGPFQWDDSLLTGLQQVDEQHRTLVELINRYSALMARGEPMDPHQLESVCDELSDYARYHFSEEQAVLGERGVDTRHVARHLREHAGFYLELARLRTEVSGELPQAPRHLLEFLGHWLAAHILGSDQSMARQLAAIEAGQSPAEAFEREELALSPSCRSHLWSMSTLSTLLSERSQECYELNRTLEDRVLQRTQELSDGNERLTRTVERLQAEQKETRRLGDELLEANRFLEANAMVDRLTGLPNLQYALDRLTNELSAAAHFGHALSIALFAADGFKEANATLGHDSGNQIIQTLGALLGTCFRPHDVICHVGIEEFLVICPRSSYADVLFLLDGVRAALPGLLVKTATGEWQGAVSAGIAEYSAEFDTVTKLLQAATARRCRLEAQVLSGGAD